MGPMDITEDLGQIYDDVMQCVYDDVDVKYDDLVQLGDASEAPVPPPRLRLGSVDAGVEKPLPGVPRNMIISKKEERKRGKRKRKEKEERERGKRKRKEKEERERGKRKRKEKEKRERGKRKRKEKETEEGERGRRKR